MEQWDVLWTLLTGTKTSRLLTGKPGDGWGSLRLFWASLPEWAKECMLEGGKDSSGSVSAPTAYGIQMPREYDVYYQIWLAFMRFKICSFNFFSVKCIILKVSHILILIITFKLAIWKQRYCWSCHKVDIKYLWSGHTVECKHQNWQATNPELCNHQDCERLEGCFFP